MPIDERAIVAKVLAGYTDPNYEERPGFFPFKLEADRIVTTLETARADANQPSPALSEAGYKAACADMERQKAAIPGLLAENVCISSLCMAYKDGAQADGICEA
jgi:hypothetical protein